VLKKWLALNFKFSLNPLIDLAIWINHSLREGLRVFARLENVEGVSRINSLQRWRLGGIIAPLEKLAVL
jgi:hypothetical protein